MAPRAVAPVADSWSIWRRVRLVSVYLFIEGILEQFVQSPKLVSIFVNNVLIELVLYFAVLTVWPAVRCIE